MNTPLISVLVTSYNREKYIGACIESILNSTFKDYELLVVDDCSTDNTISIVREYQLKDSRIKLYINDKNLGQFENRNKAASLATGQYLKYLDSDDLLETWGLAYCVEQMELFPDAGWGTFCKSLPTYTCKYLLPKEIIQEHFYCNNILSVGPSGTIIKKSIFDKINGFDQRFGVAADNHFNLLLASQYPTVLLPELFIFYREHEGQERNNELGYLINNYLYLKDLLDKNIFPLKVDQQVYLRQKMNKRFSVNLVKYFIKTKSVSAVFNVMNKTDYTFNKFIKGFTY